MTSLRPRCLPLLAAPLLLASAAGAWADAFMAGRPVDPDRSLTLQLSAGQITDIEGSVVETTRPYFNVIGKPEKNLKNAQSYDFDELGLDKSEITYGISVETRGRYFTWRTDVSYLQAEASAVAPRDFFIGVDDIEFQGKSYNYMKLEDGRPYTATLEAAMIGTRLQYTPFTIAPRHAVSFTPWIHVGIFALTGQFEVDQGEPERIQVYENPPHEYVVGGHGEGDAGALSPEIGAGGEFNLRIGNTRHGPVELSLQGTYAIFEYHGSAQSLSVGNRNDKVLDLNYEMIEGRAMMYWPISKGADFVVGGEYRVVSADGSSKAKDRTTEEIIAKREKFDKDIDLQLTMVNGFMGFRW